VPADPRFDRWARYAVAEGNVAPAYKSPELVEWDDAANPHVLILTAEPRIRNCPAFSPARLASISPRSTVNSSGAR
jgi:hypothetical protein